MLAEGNELKSNNNINNVSNHSKEFIINEINERNLRFSNLIFNNAPESNSNNFADRLIHDTNLISKTSVLLLATTII